MKSSKQFTRANNHRLALMFGAALVTLLVTLQSWASPVSTVTMNTDAPFNGAWVSTPLTSNDGLLTVAGWKDTSATVPANLYQWFLGLGVDSGVGNGALIDGQESMTLQFDQSVACDHIFFNYTGNDASPSTPAQVAISGFLSDPGAYAIVYNAPRISNLSYANGTLTFDYLYDAGSDYGQLFFANPAAGAGRTLKLNYNTTGGGAMVNQVASQEAYGCSQLQAVSVKYNATSVHTTADGALTVRGYSDANAQTPANFGTYLDQCFGVYGGNNGALDGTESVTLQFASSYGLSRLEGVYASGQVSISGFLSDPGFTDPANGSFGMIYSAGVLSFYPMDGGHYTYFFTNRAASAGQTLRINVDPGSGYSFAIAGIGYANLRTVFGPDIPAGASSYITPDGLVTLNAYSDTPGATPASFNQTVYNALDWLGISGGSTSQAIEGTESLSMQFDGTVGLTGLGSRYIAGNIIISGFTSDPGLVGPTGAPMTGSTYAGGTLTVPAPNPYYALQTVMRFTNPGASAGQTLSLHTDGSSGAQLSLAQINYAPVQVRISLAQAGNKVVLTWPAGTLLQSTSASSNYSEVPGATSPYTNTISGTHTFFRVKVQ